MHINAKTGINRGFSVSLRAVIMFWNVCLLSLIHIYNEAEDLINIGAYKAGSNPGIDYAISKIQEVNAFLQQDVNDKFTFEETIQLLEHIFEGS